MFVYYIQLQSIIQQIEDGILAHTRLLQSSERTSEIQNTKQSMTSSYHFKYTKGIIYDCAFLFKLLN